MAGFGVADLTIGGYVQAGQGVLSSPGLLWNERTNNHTADIRGIAYGNDVLVAVDEVGGISRSTDFGSTWGSLVTDPFSTSLIADVAFGNDVFVAGTSDDKIARSTDDGASWGSLISNPFTNGVSAIAYGNGVFVAVGGGGEIARSTDYGVSWGSLITTPGSLAYEDVYYGNGVWIAVGGDGIDRSTDDGATWSNIESGIAYSVRYANSVWLVGGNDGTTEIRRSVNNGATWSTITDHSFTGDSIYSLIWANGVWIGGGATGIVQRSIDNGLSWGTEVYGGSDFSLPISGMIIYDGLEIDGQDRSILVGSDGSTGAGIITSDWLEAGSGIVEAGSDTNGSYRKFSDGTMIQWGTVTATLAVSTAYAGGYRSSGGSADWTFPEAFASAPNVTYKIGEGTLCVNVIDRTSFPTATGGGALFIAMASQSSASRSFDWSAIGTWK